MEMYRDREQEILDYHGTAARYEALRAEHAAQIQTAEAELAERAAVAGFVWVVLDDDPTGVQTVHDLPVYTDWSRETLRAAFAEKVPMFYILTNSRGLTGEETAALHRELMDNLCEAAGEAGPAASEARGAAGEGGIAAGEGGTVGAVSFQVISRSDSTLRGHFPLETDLIGECLARRGGRGADGVILAPFFQAGGRLTVEDVHYVRSGGKLIPAAQTEFARDVSFGYAHSFLPAYIEEKTGGRVRAEEVLSIPLECLACGDVDAAERVLLRAGHGQAIVVNAMDSADLRVFAAALYRAIARGKRFLCRTAADFVKAAGNISDRPLLTAAEMYTESQRSRGGVIVAGSHTEKTTRQLERLRALQGFDFIEFDSDLVLTGRLAEEASRVRILVESDVKHGITPVFYTKRRLLELPGDTKEQALRRSVAISEALVSVIGEMETAPAYVIAKGGITSSDVGTKALGVKRAWVLGQLLPGIPVWRCGAESRFPGIPYVIFPGNVGEEDSLYQAARILEGQEEPAYAD